MAKGRPRSFDKDEALDIALKLFWQYGYEGASISQLADAMGIKIPSLYAAFGHKENLFKQAVQRYGELNGKLYHDSFAKKTAKEVIQSILEGEVELVTRETCPDGCLVIQGALATSPASESVRKFMCELRAMAESWMRERFERARKEGDLPPEADPATLACYVMALNSGIAVQAKSGVGKERLIQVVRHVMESWPYK